MRHYFQICYLNALDGPYHLRRRDRNRNIQDRSIAGNRSLHRLWPARLSQPYPSILDGSGQPLLGQCAPASTVLMLPRCVLGATPMRTLVAPAGSTHAIPAGQGGALFQAVALTSVAASADLAQSTAAST
jgi:hypothetical protein